MRWEGSEPSVVFDFEGRSAVDLKAQGAYRYAEDRTTEVLNAAWFWTADGSPGFWRPGMPLCPRLASHVAAGGRFVAHNAGFERLIWNIVWRRALPELPELRIAQQSCTMARASAHGLPAGLDKLAAALQLPEQKDMDGHAAMMKLCKPRGYADDGSPIFWERDTAPELFEKLDAYVVRDAATELLADRSVPELSESERAVWELDQIINDRGFPVDLASVHKTKLMADRVREKEGRRLWELTGGVVKSVTAHVRTAQWINSRGLPCDSVSADASDTLKPIAYALGLHDVVEVLEIREDAGKASVSKLDAALRTASSDGRCRGQLRYHGAGPGRWTGQLFQPQNIVRVDPEVDGPLVDAFFRALADDMPTELLIEVVSGTLGPPIKVASKALRGMIKAEQGKRLVGGDYSNIEGRGSAWLGGEAWKLDAFRAYDEGTGPDLYKLAVSRSFGTPVEDVGKTERQLGKVQELALGFQGGVKAFLSMAANYRVSLDAVLATVRGAADPALWADAESRYTRQQAYDLPVDLWTALKVLVMAWRKAHPGIVKGWWDIQDAAVDAVSNPGLICDCVGGRVRYLCSNGFLFCQLPSTRVICYAKPFIKVRQSRRPHPGFEHLLDSELDDSNSYVEREQRQVHFWGVEQGTKRWTVKALYGGLQWENVVQGTARDIMVRGMFNVERAGYPVILTVHDEVLSEVPSGFGSASEFRHLMAHPLPEFVPGLPLAASAWEDARYVK